MLTMWYGAETRLLLYASLKGFIDYKKNTLIIQELI
jgi:hypothetical protein